MSNAEKMNGAELPCGSVLRVEEARSNRDSELKQSRQAQPSNEKTVQTSSEDPQDHPIEVPKEERKECKSADPELDAFFDSL